MLRSHMLGCAAHGGLQKLLPIGEEKRRGQGEKPERVRRGEDRMKMKEMTGRDKGQMVFLLLAHSENGWFTWCSVL
jgi:hypothetical protein